MDTRATGMDVVHLVLDDHEELEKLLAATHDVATIEDTFGPLVRALVIHEVVEEEILYPAFRRVGGDESVMDSRMTEQRGAERLLLQMEHMRVGTSAFFTALDELEQSVTEHAHREEQLVLPVLKSSMEDDERRKLGRVYAAAKKVAPTHPHPRVPDTPPGNLVVGPLVGLFDRARDAARSAMARARA